MKKLLSLLISIVLCFTLFTACTPTDTGDGDGTGDGGLGGLQMKSFTLVENSVTKEYTVGDVADFSGIKVNITYNDNSYNKQLIYSDLILEGTENLTATKGEKTVKVKYNDAVIAGAVRELSFKVNVYISADEMVEYVTTTEYTDPVFLTQRKNVISKAGSTAYGDAQYAGQFFANQDTTYYVGDDNKFKFVPQITVLNFEGETETLPNFFSDIKVSLKVNNAYVPLEAVEDNDSYDVDFVYENNVLVTANTKNNTYQFNPNGSAIDKEFKIEVVPASNYNYDGAKVSTIEVKVIDAYNVYDAKELSVIDNRNASWNTIKESLGLLNTTVNGVVLHNDISVLAEHLPDDFFVPAEVETVFTDGDNTNNIPDVTIKVGDKLLRDNKYIYLRQSAGNFTIQGNYYTISVANLPVVGAPAVFGAGSDLSYGADYSNATLFNLSGTGVTEGIYFTDGAPSTYINVAVNNLALIGNASRNELLATSNGDPLSAGGLQMFNSRKSTSTITNVISNSFYMAYNSDSNFTHNTRNVTNLNYVKCYDSYQCAGLIWCNAEINVTNSNIENAGGPLFLLQHVTDDANVVANITGIPEFHADSESTLVSMLTGEEAWFTNVQATPFVAQLKALDTMLFPMIALQTEGQVNKSMMKGGRFNMIAVSMANASNADPSVMFMSLDAEAVISVGGVTLNRKKGTDNRAAFESYLAQGCKIIGADTTDAIQGNVVVDASNNLANDPTAFIGAIATSKYVTITMGALGIFFEAYDVPV